MPERKDSIESVEQEGAQISIKIKGGKILIDVRPEYAFDDDKKHRILSNTRLVVDVNLNKLFLTICS